MGQSISRQDIARDYLRRAQEAFILAAHNRVNYIALAREYGITNSEIGSMVGVSESAVRALLKRHGDA